MTPSAEIKEKILESRMVVGPAKGGRQPAAAVSVTRGASKKGG